ncbi:MAG: D-alanyl-D-alanine carboxypeptidase family protein [Halioglobus sp.]|nr:D-alanyl-D-alanine carboxypeptidase family protein [Halioglobus sp.]
MLAPLKAGELTGLSDTHLVTLADGQRLHADAARAWTALVADARAAGFDLAIVSSFRSCARQVAIWNGKVRGERAVHDDTGMPVDISALPDTGKVLAILRFSALPGTSRHHWGTDLDVYDAAAVPQDYNVQLSPAEVAPGGVFDALHVWLDARMAAGESHGFYRPYDRDRGGVAPERWHLSYAPVARECAGLLDAAELVSCWDGSHCEEPLLLKETVEALLPELLERYVAVPANWCEPG